MFDIVSLGELLIDFTPSGKSEAGNTLYEQNPGGAPANVAAAVSKLGGKSAFIGKVGYDAFGWLLKETLIKNGIEARGLRMAVDIATTLVKYAKQKGLMISYDPNLRLSLWPDAEMAKSGILAGLHYADILKISEKELAFITDTTEYEQGSKILYDKGVRFVVITLGGEGCFYRYKHGVGYITTYGTKAVDTTGSGDAFTGAMLYSLAKRKKSLEDIHNLEMIEILTYANASGALCATKRGAIPAMSGEQEIQECMRGTIRLVR